MCNTALEPSWPWVGCRGDWVPAQQCAGPCWRGLKTLGHVRSGYRCRGGAAGCWCHILEAALPRTPTPALCPIRDGIGDWSRPSLCQFQKWCSPGAQAQLLTFRPLLSLSVPRPQHDSSVFSNEVLFSWAAAVTAPGGRPALPCPCARWTCGLAWWALITVFSAAGTLSGCPCSCDQTHSLVRILLTSFCILCFTGPPNYQWFLDSH